MEANLRMFEGLGLDFEDVERMAARVDLEADDLLLLSTRVSICSSRSEKAKPKSCSGSPSDNEHFGSQDRQALAEDFQAKILLYESEAPFRRSRPSPAVTPARP